MFIVCLPLIEYKFQEGRDIWCSRYISSFYNSALQLNKDRLNVESVSHLLTLDFSVCCITKNLSLSWVPDTELQKLLEFPK